MVFAGTVAHDGFDHRGTVRRVIGSFLIRRFAHMIAALYCPKEGVRNAALDPKRQSQAVSSVIVNMAMLRGIRSIEWLHDGSPLRHH